jgi:hypothetical protein
MRKALLLVPTLALGLAGTIGTAEYAAGAGAATTTVTIKAEGVDLSGTISSPKPKRCAAGREVLLIKQIGTRGGGDDDKIGSDTAELESGVYRWDTGNTGISGKFYAKVKAITGCKGATSKTIKATR